MISDHFFTSPYISPSAPIAGDELEHLGMVIEAYEDKHHPIELPDPISAIQFRMEQEGLKNKDLVPILGSSAKVSEVLSGNSDSRLHC